MFPFANICCKLEEKKEEEGKLILNEQQIKLRKVNRTSTHNKQEFQYNFTKVFANKSEFV